MYKTESGYSNRMAKSPQQSDGILRKCYKHPNNFLATSYQKVVPELSPGTFHHGVMYVGEHDQDHYFVFHDCGQAYCHQDFSLRKNAGVPFLGKLCLTVAPPSLIHPISVSSHSPRQVLLGTELFNSCSYRYVFKQIVDSLNRDYFIPSSTPSPPPKKKEIVKCFK